MTAADPRDGLLPCPFCGGHPRLDESRITQGFSVHCPNCDACGGWQEGNSADQTIAAWNRRFAHARPEAVDEAMVDRAAAAIANERVQPAVVGDVDALVAVAEKAWNDHQAACRITTVSGSLRKVCEAIAALTPAATPGDDLYRDDWISQAEMDQRLEHLAEEYEWRGDDGDYTPNERERMLLIDFCHGILADEIFVAMMKAHHDPNAKGRPAQKEGNGNGR